MEIMKLFRGFALVLKKLNYKSIFFTSIMCLVSTMLFAQDYSYYQQMVRQRLAEGNCEKAQENYRVYKEMTGLSDYELEVQIRDCFNKGSWREIKERSEILLMRVHKEYSIQVPGKLKFPSEREVYNKVLMDVRRDYPNGTIGIRKVVGSNITGTYKGYWSQGILRNDYTDCICDLTFEILKPNIRYYLNEAIRSANDGSRIALNQILYLDKADESLENQLMDILFDEGFRVVNSISNADYYINVKMYGNSLQIRMVNAVTGEYEGVSLVKYDGFIY